MIKTTTRRPLTEAAPPPAAVRVAIYTRKSTDEGLDQEFNSLDAQREAVEAYVASQRGEGWVALPEKYDDGGFTGANTERPAFQRLLTDIHAGKVDAVGVYKIDRLSRSLLDFLKVMEVFTRYGVTFFSVTQQFSTTSPVGRLTLNVLMSFAEFERQVISERTRDKIAASRKKGFWCGGRPVLGYDAVNKELVINPAEADQVRTIFKLYLELGSLLTVSAELERRGWTNKSWTNRDGRQVRGKGFDKHAVRRVLANPLYLGKTCHKGQTYDGVHEAIIDETTWNAVEHQLRQHGRNGGSQAKNKHGALLRGIVRCGVCGSAMTYTHTQRGSRRYAYYVCQKVQKEGAAACPGSRAAAGDLEACIVDHIRKLGRDPQLIAATVEAAKQDLGAREPELVAELRRLDQEARQLAGERRNLLDAVATGGPAVSALTARLGEVDGNLQGAVLRAAEVRADLTAIERQVIDEADLRAALAGFDPIWDELFPRERARIFHLLMEAVTYDARDREVAITFRAGGVRALAAEVRASA